MGSPKCPCGKTIEGGRLQELLAESLAYVIDYQSYHGNNIKNSFLLPITKEVHEFMFR